jgi:hypothetical protein
MLQITSRIFIDDLNKALEKNTIEKHFTSQQKETPEEVALFKNI